MSKVIVVTGASSGVGRDIVEFFGEKGWTAIALGRRKDATFNSENIHYFPLDISNWKDVKKKSEEITSKFPKINLLVNNAAVFKLKSFSELEIEDIDSMIDTNLKGSIYITKALLSAMVQKTGRIVNISSVAGTHGIKGQAVYCASKFGLNGFSEALNQELIEMGISMTTICPGGINTPLWNEQSNPYPGGDVDQLIPAREITNLVHYISELPNNIVLKNMTLFPDNEWH